MSCEPGFQPVRRLVQHAESSTAASQRPRVEDVCVPNQEVRQFFQQRPAQPRVPNMNLPPTQLGPLQTQSGFEGAWQQARIPAPIGPPILREIHPGRNGSVIVVYQRQASEPPISMSLEDLRELIGYGFLPQEIEAARQQYQLENAWQPHFQSTQPLERAWQQAQQTRLASAEQGPVFVGLAPQRRADEGISIIVRYPDGRTIQVNPGNLGASGLSLEEIGKVHQALAQQNQRFDPGESLDHMSDNDLLILARQSGIPVGRDSRETYVNLLRRYPTRRWYPPGYSGPLVASDFIEPLTPDQMDVLAIVLNTTPDSVLQTLNTIDEATLRSILRALGYRSSYNESRLFLIEELIDIFLRGPTTIPNLTSQNVFTLYQAGLGVSGEMGPEVTAELQGLSPDQLSNLARILQSRNTIPDIIDELSRMSDLNLDRLLVMIGIPLTGMMGRNQKILELMRFSTTGTPPSSRRLDSLNRYTLEMIADVHGLLHDSLFNRQDLIDYLRTWYPDGIWTPKSRYNLTPSQVQDLAIDLGVAPNEVEERLARIHPAALRDFIERLGLPLPDENQPRGDLLRTITEAYRGGRQQFLDRISRELRLNPEQLQELAWEYGIEPNQVYETILHSSTNDLRELVGSFGVSVDGLTRDELVRKLGWIYRHGANFDIVVDITDPRQIEWNKIFLQESTRNRSRYSHNTLIQIARLLGPISPGPRRLNISSLIREILRFKIPETYSDLFTSSVANLQIAAQQRGIPWEGYHRNALIQRLIPYYPLMVPGTKTRDISGLEEVDWSQLDSISMPNIRRIATMMGIATMEQPSDTTVQSIPREELLSQIRSYLPITLQDISTRSREFWNAYQQRNIPEMLGSLNTIPRLMFVPEDFNPWTIEYALRNNQRIKYGYSGLEPVLKKLESMELVRIPSITSRL